MEVRVNIEPSRNFSSKHLAVFKNDSAGRWRGAPSNIHTAGPLDFKRGVHLAGRNLAVFVFCAVSKRRIERSERGSIARASRLQEGSRLAAARPAGTCT